MRSATKLTPSGPISRGWSDDPPRDCVAVAGSRILVGYWPRGSEDFYLEYTEGDGAMTDYTVPGAGFCSGCHNYPCVCFNPPSVAPPDYSALLLRISNALEAMVEIMKQVREESEDGE